MLLELTGARAVHRPVPGVVRPHREFVDDQSTVDRLEQFDGEHSDDAESRGHAQRQFRSSRTGFLRQVGGGRDHRDTDPVALDRLDDRPRGALSER